MNALNPTYLLLDSYCYTTNRQVIVISEGGYVFIPNRVPPIILFGIINYEVMEPKAKGGRIDHLNLLALDKNF
jgi:hypothetical protein